MKNRLTYTLMFAFVLGIYGVLIAQEKPKPIPTIKYESKGSSTQINVGTNEGTIINNLIINSIDYKELTTRYEKSKEERDKIVKRIKTYPTDESFKKDLITINLEIEETEKNIESFKTNVGRLYESFSKIEINTERLRQAKTHFDKGEIKQANAILKAEELANDQTKLLCALELKEKEVTTIKKQLNENATEYFVKAQTTALQYDLPDRFNLSCKYYELSLVSDKNVDILFDYAFFLAHHNQHDKAIKYYKEVLNIFRKNNGINSPTNLADVALTLNNLGILQEDQKDYVQAENSYTEALSIYRKLAQTDSSTYSPSVAMTLNNLGALQKDRHDYVQAEKSYKEALCIYRTLAQTKPQTYLQGVADVLNNLGILQKDNTDYVQAEKSYTEALSIRRTLAKTNPQAYLPGVADVLNNLGALQEDRHDYVQAEIFYKEALSIRRTLAQTNPKVYMPELAGILNNFAILYEESLVVNKDKSILCAKEAIDILIPFIGIGYIQDYLRISFRVLKYWKIDVRGYITEKYGSQSPLLPLVE